MRVVLSSDEVKVAIARFAAEKAGWGWHRDVEVKGVDFGKGIVAELRDGNEASVLLTVAASVLLTVVVPSVVVTDDETHYRSCFDPHCQWCKRVARERIAREGNG